MQILKFLLLWLITTLVVTVSWGLGSVVGHLVTRTTPVESGGNDDLFALIFLAVCAVNGALIVSLVMATQTYHGVKRWVALVLFVFGLQFGLTQLETLFFVKSFPMEIVDIVAIIISGFVMSVITVTLSTLAVNWLLTKENKKELILSGHFNTGRLILSSMLLALLLYPLLYILFGYFVAWQNTSLRIFYSGSETIKPFFSQCIDFVVDGIYIFQVFRGILWILITVPIIIMVRNTRIPYLLIGLTTALLPSSLLFIPNPYMPAEIAFIHFFETASSNFIWGTVMTFILMRYSMSAETHPNGG